MIKICVIEYTDVYSDNMGDGNTAYDQIHSYCLLSSEKKLELNNYNEIFREKLEQIQYILKGFNYCSNNDCFGFELKRFINSYSFVTREVVDVRKSKQIVEILNEGLSEPLYEFCEITPYKVTHDNWCTFNHYKIEDTSCPYAISLKDISKYYFNEKDELILLFRIYVEKVNSKYIVYSDTENILSYLYPDQKASLLLELIRCEQEHPDIKSFTNKLLNILNTRSRFAQNRQEQLEFRLSIKECCMFEYGVSSFFEEARSVEHNIDLKMVSLNLKTFYEYDEEDSHLPPF